MTREDFLLSYGRLMESAGIRHFRAYEGCDVGRVHQPTGTVLEAPPVELWEKSLEVWRVLMWLRAHDGEAPVDVNSGYRSPAYNAAIGGASGSQHLRFTARDVTKRGRSPLWVAKNLIEHPGGSSLGVGLYKTFVHVDTRGFRARWAGAGVDPGWHAGR